ncbi:hypothetical protein [Cronobacter dublinensis]|uniref:hypothetical protein n=1 Tax=Cronobacter dublinensis TaxID=413497 RepID=UPI00131A0117|nr:hypothetical protein [Cronobacter dublinensis]EKK4000308.1 hypothetical protein [Cronobacter sakazakii]
MVKQPLFWSVILVPVLLFLYFGFFSWKGHLPQLDSNGFINFYNISKIPLLLLASSVPLAAMVANLHRTIQTESQINETKKKNSIDLYYSHIKFYTESFSKIPSYELELHPLKKEIQLSHHFTLYKIIFPNSSPESNSTTEVNNDILEKVRHSWSMININLGKHNSEYEIYLKNKESYDFSKLAALINAIELELLKICKYIFITGYHYSKSAIYNYGPSAIKPSANVILHSMFFNHKDICETIEKVEKICSRLFDIINSNNLNRSNIFENKLLDETHWLSFELFTTLDEHRPILNMPYRQPEFKP